MNTPLEDLDGDEDFAELLDFPLEPAPADDSLDALLAESLELINEEKRVAKARKRLAEAALPPTEREALALLVAEYDEKRTWETVANVGLIHVQHCTTCGHDSQLFMGWMKEQRHRTKEARRLVAGESPAPSLPRHVERHMLAPKAQCPFCIDGYIGAKQALVPYTFVPNLAKREPRDVQ